MSDKMLNGAAVISSLVRGSADYAELVRSLKPAKPLSVSGITDSATPLFIATLAEMPVLVYFDRVRKYIPVTRLLKLAGCSFLLKSVLLLMAPSVTAIYWIQLLQATSYGFLSPTQLYYANSKVAQADMVKGQAFITAAYTLGCAIGNFTGGQLLDLFNVRILLWAGVAMAAAGTAVFFVTVDKKDKVLSGA